MNINFALQINYDILLTNNNNSDKENDFCNVVCCWETSQ